MTLFGGMSEGERARIQMRVRTAMSALAQDTTRYLGGRAPYGYRLVDVGPHPNLAKANLGQRLHRLEPDPATSSVVERIYRMYADGAGLRYITQQLTDDRVPSPSQYDPVRNRHRDPRGWSHSAIRAILDNPTYVGVRVWGKQENYEVLVNPDDVAAGYETRMRWRDKADWVVPGRGGPSSWVGCQQCLVRQPGRNALRYTRPGACVWITTRNFSESRQLPTRVVSPDV